MKAANYVNVLEKHMVANFKSHHCNYFMHDGAPAHRAKLVSTFLNNNNIDVLDWPGNSPDLNPIENVWHVMKNELQNVKPTNIFKMKEALTNIWQQLDTDYFSKLAESMPKRLKLVINEKGNMAKY